MFVQERVPQFIYQDRAKLAQVLVNIIGNAVKYTNTGYVKINVDIGAKSLSSGSIVVTIKDSGKGIQNKQTLG